jgi:GNAT superfamily N-acetyltransferase
MTLINANEIRYQTDPPDKTDFFLLFETTGWNKEYRLSPEELYKAVLASWFSVSAYNREMLVGFGRMICDGVVHSLILDMIVLPEYQGKGIGTAILSRLVERCTEAGIRDIQLFSAKGKAGFYEKNGFKRRSEDGPGMEIKRKG